MRKVILQSVFVGVLVLFSACALVGGKKEQKVAGPVVEKAISPDGKTKIETTMFNEMKNGPQTYINASTGKKKLTTNYKDDVKHGEEIKYYETGKKYRVRPFVEGKFTGVEKRYSRTGKLIAETEYQNGMAGVGLKEYFSNGNLVTKYPTFKVAATASSTGANFVFTLSDSKAVAQFFVADLVDGKFLPNSKEIKPAVARGGIARTRINGLKKGQTVTVICKHVTKNRALHITTKKVTIR